MATMTVHPNANLLKSSKQKLLRTTNLSPRKGGKGTENLYSVS